MDELVTQIGVFGVFALLVIREILRFVWKKKLGEGSPVEGRLSPAETDAWTRLVTEHLIYLRTWHEKEDPETSAPRGYVPHNRIRDIERTVLEVRRDVAECKNALKKLSGG